MPTGPVGGQLVGGGLDGLGGVHAREASAVCRADGGWVVAGGARSHAHRLAEPVGAAETLVAADARARRQANPLRELLGRDAVGEEHASVLLPSPLVVTVDDVAAEAVDVHRIRAPVDGVGEYEGGLDLRLV